MSQLIKKQLTAEQQIEFDKEQSILTFVDGLNGIFKYVTPSNEEEADVMGNMLGFFNALKIAAEVSIEENYFEATDETSLKEKVLNAISEDTNNK